MVLTKDKTGEAARALLESIRETPVLELTEEAKGIIEKHYGKHSFMLNHRLFGKFEQSLPYSHSIKDRATVYMLVNGIKSGEINKETKFIVEATSGNTGIALAKAAQPIGLPVVVLISRELNKGVVKELENAGAQIVVLNTEICPVPGADGEASAAQANSALKKIKRALAKAGVAIEKNTKAGEKELIKALEGNNAIEAAKLIAKIYGGFCPRQYENPANYLAHVATTAPEVERTLKEIGANPRLTTLFFTAGTLGTVLGFAQYYGSKSDNSNMPNIEIVFPKEGQDVPGIRTLKSVEGLPFYKALIQTPIAKQVRFSEIDYYKEGKLVYVNTGAGIGHSASLAFAAAIEKIIENEAIAKMLKENKVKEARQKYGNSRVEMVQVALGSSEPLIYFVIMPDGKEKYIVEKDKNETKEVSIEEARLLVKEGYSLAWVSQRNLDEKTKRAIAERLGIEKSHIDEIGDEAMEVLSAYYGEEATYADALEKLIGRLSRSGGKAILLCPLGKTSKQVADLINMKGKKNVQVFSLLGGSEGLLAKKE